MKYGRAENNLQMNAKKMLQYIRYCTQHHRTNVGVTNVGWDKRRMRQT